MKNAIKTTYKAAINPFASMLEIGDLIAAMPGHSAEAIKAEIMKMVKAGEAWLVVGEACYMNAQQQAGAIKVGGETYYCVEIN